MMNDLYINKTGTEVNISDVDDLHGLHFLDLVVSAPQLTGNYLTNPGLDGETELAPGVFGPRTISANFYFEGADLTDFELAARAIWSYFFERYQYYIRSTQNPGIRYKVRPKPYDPTMLNYAEMTFTLGFDLPSGFGESLGITLDMFSYDSELWQVGQNLPSDKDLQYVFTGSDFQIYNASDIDIDPRQHHELQIALTCSGTPKITNQTTGDTFQMTQSVLKSDVLLIDGAYPYLNNQRCGRQTNHGIITLSKGWNSIHIDNASNIDISFLFLFLYM